jgi:signal transduction histidine kinase
MNYYRDQLVEQNRELKQMNEKVTAVNSELNEVNARLVESREAFETANKKLNLLSTITRHDIKNQLLGLLGFLELSKEKISDPEILSFIVREETAAQNIQRQIEFTKNYEDIGVRAPQWQNIGMRLYALVSSMSLGKTDVSASLDQLEIFADPLLEKVFENLIDNSLRHGDRVNHMSFSCIPHGERGIAIVYEDDGIGVHETEKERIFEKGFGKNTGLGLFLSREILSITGLNMRETGVYGKGARFEIVVPQGKYRFLTEKETS